LLLFLEKEEYYDNDWFLGARPQTPGVGFAEGWAPQLSAKQNYAFGFFFWKKKNTTTMIGYWGHAPRPPGSASPKVGPRNFLRSRTNAFCFFFWKKKDLLRIN
jgi:hypothetical protein